jgi:hypothetical protein
MPTAPDLNIDMFQPYLGRVPRPNRCMMQERLLGKAVVDLGVAAQRALEEIYVIKVSLVVFIVSKVK